MNRLSRRDLMIVAAGCAITPISASRLSAAELKVDLSKERVGQPPATFAPIVGTWRVVQDGPDKVIMVDGQPWKANQNNRTALLAERARSFADAVSRAQYGAARVIEDVVARHARRSNYAIIGRGERQSSASR